MIELEKTNAGLVELELWLQDLVRQGVAHTQKKPASFWYEIAARMIDAGASGAAWELRRIATLPKNEPDWINHLLWHIGRLFLLTQAFPHYPSLSRNKQADLLQALGLPLTKQLISPHPINDHWLHLGQREQREDGYQQRRNWFWGIESNQPALINEQTSAQKLPPPIYKPTATYQAKMQFAYSESPLEVSIHNPQQIRSAALVGFQTVREALNQYAVALGKRPWLRYYPFPLRQVIPYQLAEQWWIQDLDGIALPLPPDWRKGWQLLALSQGYPLWLFGEWNGRYLTPISCYHTSRWHLIHSWQHIS